MGIHFIVLNSAYDLHPGSLQNQWLLADLQKNEKSKGVYYIVTGGGGAPLYKQERKIPESQLYLETYHFCMITVENQTLTMVALAPDLKKIDRVVIRK